MAKAVYMHIPFCHKICNYCDFCKFIYNEKIADAYLVALKNEIIDRYMDEAISTLSIGGGTPSALTLKEIRALLELTKLFKMEDKYEFTFEMNLEDINKELLVILKYYGVNRLSIGIESFQPKNLTFMGRQADFQDALAKIKLCREMGFNNINVDLMYAIPKETMKDLKKDLDLFLKLEPDHISTYSLIIEENTKAFIDNYDTIDEELDYNMYLYICKKLNNAHHYELSNFALPGYESKHNLVYWDNEEYYGFGLGAAGYVDGVRYENTKNLKKYLVGEYVKTRELVNRESKMKYEVILGLRKIEGINKKKFQDKYHIDLENVFDLKKLFKDKDLINKKEYICINPDKLYVMNEILLKIEGLI